MPQYFTTTNIHSLITPEHKNMLTNSVSEQNVYFTYVCLVNNINPSNHIRDNKFNEVSYNICGLEDEDVSNFDDVCTYVSVYTLILRIVVPATSFGWN